MLFMNLIRKVPTFLPASNHLICYFLLIAILTSVPQSIWPKRVFIAFTIGLTTEHGILLAGLLVGLSILVSL